MRIQEKHQFSVLDLGIEGIAAPCGCGELDILIGNSKDRPLHVLPGNSTIYLCGTCTSTFDVAWKLHGACLSCWGSVIAYAQTRGRGQMRRIWHSPPGNLYVSCILPDAFSAFGDAATLVASYLLLLALRGEGCNLYIKWPNDFMSVQAGDYRKAGGVLLEERDGTLTAGFGLNLLHAPSSEVLHNNRSTAAAVSSGKAPAILWAHLIAAMQEHYADLHMLSRQNVLRLIESELVWRGQSVCLHDNGQTYRGTLVGLSTEGHVLLQEEQGVAAFSSGTLQLA